MKASTIQHPGRLAAACASILLAGAALLAASPARADRDEQRGPPGRTQAQRAAAAPQPAVEIRVGAVFTDQNRESVNRYYTQRTASTGRCPPGLAKKNNGCQPPGQARKFELGQPLPADVVWYSVPPAVVSRLPRLPADHRYVRIGADIVLLRGATNVVIDVMAVLPLSTR